MQPELSMPMQDKAASQRNFFPATGSKFEPLLIKTLCEPLLPYIPARVHPNTISLIKHGVVWTTALLAFASVTLSPLGKALALIGAGIGMFASMIGDCLGSLHARRTHQPAQLSVMMDYWLDALVVPLAAASIAVALQMPAWAMVTVTVTAAMIYNAQLVLYHHSGEFVHPEPVTGIEGQFGLSIGYIVLAGLLYCVDRRHAWLDMAVAALAVGTSIVQLRCSLFYYSKLGRALKEHLWFVASCAGFGAAFLLRAIDLRFFLLAIVFTSFRICGTYVIRTLMKEPYDGRDFSLLAFIAAIFVVHFGIKPAPLGALRLTNLLAALSCAFVIARNLQDLSRHYGALKPRTA